MIVSGYRDGGSGIGGKAASLAWLVDAGYRCPPFDVLDASCWNSMLAGHGMSRNRSTLRFGTDQLSFALACHELSVALEHEPLPAAVGDWLAASPLGRLGTPVAVRSSALSEDGSGSSSAGQYESVLGVSDVPALEQAIRRVLVSYYSERAVLYRRAQGIDDGARLAMGVIVQRLVPARVSGVAFSVDPVTDGAERVVVEATLGLGPVLVSGEADPDRFYVSRDLSSISHRVGRKAKSLAYDDGTGTIEETHAAASTQLCISPEQAREVAGAVIAMHDALGYAVDVEWALPSDADVEPIYLQMRPVTRARSIKPPKGLVPTF